MNTQTAPPTPSEVDRPRAETQPGGGRLAGVDVARAVAILGMVTVHFGPFEVVRTDPVAFVYTSFYGKASVLFVVVAGMGVALLARGRSDREVRARLLYRCVWLLPLGLVLQELDHPVAVILQYYAVYFVALAPFVGRRDRTLLGWAAVLLAAGSAVVLAARVLVPGWVVPTGGDASPLGIPGDLVLVGYYPLVTWISPMLIGLWLGRRDLTDSRVRWWMVGAGTAALGVTTVAGRALQDLLSVTPMPEGSWGWVLTTEGHSEMPLAVIGATGFAVAVVGLSLLVASRWPRALWPMTAFGRVALSVYVIHLVVYHLAADLLRAEDLTEGVRTVLAFGVVSSLLAMAWLTFTSRGPLEHAVRWPWQRLVRPLAVPREVRSSNWRSGR